MVDYYPFGSSMAGRKYNQGTYRYGFNGMEKDDEMKGEGNSYDFGARMYDSRIGRWLAVDPLAAKHPALSPYHYSRNSPMIFSDKDGRDGKLTIKPNKEGGGGTITLSTTVFLTGDITPEKVIEINNRGREFFKSGTYTKTLEDGTTETWNIEFEVNYEYTATPEIKLEKDQNLLDVDKDLVENAKIDGSLDRAHIISSTGLLRGESTSEEKGGFTFYTYYFGTLIEQRGGKVKPSDLDNGSLFHETLHFLGEIDRYYEHKYEGKGSKAHKGFEKNIMANTLDGIIEQFNYDLIGDAYSNLSEGVYHINEFRGTLLVPEDADRSHDGATRVTEIRDKNDKVLSEREEKIDLGPREYNNTPYRNRN